MALGAKDAQTIKAFQEAESFDGPSLIIAYSPCIEHGYDMGEALAHETMAVDSGYWPLYRFDPRLLDQGKAPLQLDAREPTLPVAEYLVNENRFRQIQRKDPERFDMLMGMLEAELAQRRRVFEALATVKAPDEEQSEAAE